MFNCPVDFSAGQQASQPFRVSYWMNKNLWRQVPSQIATPESTLLVGEGSDGRETIEAAYAKTALPPLWLTDTKSPAYRHFGGANYLMTDGSVHWLKPDEVTSFGRRENAFALR